jgi:FkbM family methyltransferase
MFFKNLSSHFHKVWEEVHASLAYRYFEKIRPIHASQFPQMCCYSFDHISHEINFRGQFEKTELLCLITNFKKYMSGKTVLDIGANIGNHSLAFSPYCKQVFAFEPHPKTFRLLELNTMDVGNIDPINVGASDSTCKMKAVDTHYNMGGAKLIDDSFVANEKISNYLEFSLVPLDSMDQLQNTDIGFVKIDVEGHELQAFKGAKRLLEKHHPVIAFEQLEESFNQGTSDVIEFLKNTGYKKFFVLQRRRNWRFSNRLMKFFEAIFLGIPEDKSELLETQYFQKKFYSMIIASSED